MRNLLVVCFFWMCVLYTHAQGFVGHEVLVQLSNGAEPKELTANFSKNNGSFSRFHLKEVVSAPMRIYLYAWEGDLIQEQEVLLYLSTLKDVQTAQLNHFIQDRNVPNDPLVGSQWHFADPQDNDIDADLAWDITTGGQTALGDQIVACVVETQGAKWDQEDILPNHWVNIHEVPDNGLDDDGNGYVDDYDGWNVSSNSDNSSNGNHGTQVSSMIGAKGNNALGVSGVNWDVKLMQVQMGGITEASVISAYTYPLVMRQLYNNTNGQLGAFVVVTNSSWGIDNAMSSGYPLWCQMYDTLGHYGIISCAATANNNVNVDNVGDMPTTCPSDYLIAVSATNSSDVRTFSGYGTTNIDLGAPGENVLMAGNTSYATASGTSFASPCVAGSVALLYSAPCLSFASLVHSSPQTAAQWVRNYLLNGVDAVTNLSAEVATGGRLNVRNSLDLLMNECSNSNCLAPYDIQVATNETSSTVGISWSAMGSGEVEMQIRTVGSTNWSTISQLSSSISFDTLQTCALYEFQLRMACDTAWSDWSILYNFTTVGCCYHPQSFIISGVTELNTTLEWPSIFASQGYTVALTANGQQTQEFTTNVPSITWMDLIPCTDYTAVIYSNCADPMTQLIYANWTTLGCMSCSEMQVCQGLCTDAGSEWIEQVSLGAINNLSGTDGGYGDYTSLTTALVLGQTYPMTITPGFGSVPYVEYTKVWIDWDGSGTFEDTELVFDPGQGSSAVVNANITVPMTATLGSARMRIGLTYYGVLGSGQIPEACGSFAYGEFEDYCLTIQETALVSENQELPIILYPNPNDGHFMLSGLDGFQSVEILDTQGRVVYQSKGIVTSNWNIDLKIAPGVYWVMSQGKDGGKKTKMIVN
jgi:serine protease